MVSTPAFSFIAHPLGSTSSSRGNDPARAGVLLPGTVYSTSGSCQGENPRPYDACITIEVTTAFGHEHSEGMPTTVPIGGPACQRNIPGNTPVSWQFLTPEFASELKATLSLSGWCSETIEQTAIVAIAGLEELGPSPHYVLEGEKPWHPWNHYAVPQFRAQLDQMAAAWNLECPFSEVVHFNDMSLPWGGLFDVNQNWRLPHRGHRYGTNADVSKRRVKYGNRLKFINNLCQYARVQSEGDAPEEAPHYHLTQKNSTYKDDFDEKLVDCCIAPPIPQECIELGPRFPENPEAGDCE